MSSFMPPGLFCYTSTPARGLDLETRLAVVREIYESSDHATVHVKDHISGPETFVPFVRAVLVGLKDYAPPPSPRVPVQARQPWLSTDS